MNAIKVPLLRLCVVSISLMMLSAQLAGHAIAASDEPASDLAMIEKLQTHRDKFELLIRMVHEDDGLRSIAVYENEVLPFVTDPSDVSKIGITPEKLKNYIDLLKTLGLKGMQVSKEEESITLYAYLKQIFAWRHVSKSYVWANKGVPTYVSTVSDLDVYWQKKNRNVMAYRPVEGKWHLYYRVD